MVGYDAKIYFYVSLNLTCSEDDFLRRLGKVVHRLKQQHLVVIKPSNPLPPLGLGVYSREGMEVGRVHDIIGNLRSPYAVLKLHDVKFFNVEDFFIKD